MCQNNYMVLLRRDWLIVCSYAQLHSFVYEHTSAVQSHCLGILINGLFWLRQLLCVLVNFQGILPGGFVKHTIIQTVHHYCTWILKEEEKSYSPRISIIDGRWLYLYFIHWLICFSLTFAVVQSRQAASCVSPYNETNPSLWVLLFLFLVIYHNVYWSKALYTLCALQTLLITTVFWTLNNSKGQNAEMKKNIAAAVKRWKTQVEKADFTSWDWRFWDRG